MSDFIGFFGNVISHWVALMSGVFSVILAIVGQQRKWEKVATRLFWILAAIAVFFGCFQARQDEHRNTEVVKQEKAQLAGEKNTCSFEKLLKEKDIASLNSLHATDASTAASNRSIIDGQQQNASRQSTQIGQCLIDEGKMNPVINTKFKVVVIPFYDRDVPSDAPPVSNQSAQYSVMLIQVNRRQEPDGTLRCAQDFSIVTPPRISTNTSGFQHAEFTHPQQSDGHAYKLHFQSSASWEDGNPIHFIVESQSDVLGLLGSCTFNPSL